MSDFGRGPGEDSAGWVNSLGYLYLSTPWLKVPLSAVLGKCVLTGVKGVVRNPGPIEPAPGRSFVRQDFHGPLDAGASMAHLEPFGALPVLVSKFSVEAR